MRGKGRAREGGEDERARESVCGRGGRERERVGSNMKPPSTLSRDPNSLECSSALRSDLLYSVAVCPTKGYAQRPTHNL